MPRKVKKEYPEPVKKIVITHYRGPDTEDKVRRQLRRHYREWADLQVWEMRLITGDYDKKRKNGELTLTPPTRITLSGPKWSHPQPKELSE